MPLFSAFLDLLFPRRCFGCGAPGRILCASCSERIPLRKEQECPVCRNPSDRGRTCVTCHGTTHLDGVIVAATFNNPLIRELIHRLKYAYVEDAALTLGDLLSRVLKENVDSAPWTLTPIPLHWKRNNTRGFNQAALIAHACASAANLTVAPLLVRRARTSQQAKLGKEGRQQNLKGAFALAPKLVNVPQFVMLVDDVMTTGATLDECAAVLKSAGARQVYGLVVARGELRVKSLKP